MLERFWTWAEKSRERLSGSLFVIGAVIAVGFFWHYHRSPIFALFDAKFAIHFLAASARYLLELRNG
jgi:putative flippase GtrA